MWARCGLAQGRQQRMGVPGGEAVALPPLLLLLLPLLRLSTEARLRGEGNPSPSSSCGCVVRDRLLPTAPLLLSSAWPGASGAAAAGSAAASAGGAGSAFGADLRRQSLPLTSTPSWRAHRA